MNAVVDSPPKCVLDPERHARLIADFDQICAVANVPRKYVRESMTNVCDSAEIDYVVNFKLYRESYPGFIIVGKSQSEERCMAIAGALVRNFIDARVVTLTSLLDATENHEVPEPTVMVIPNLYMKSYGKTLPAWKVSAVYDVLVSRWTANKPTVMALECLKGLEQSYGLAFAEHLNNYKGAK